MACIHFLDIELDQDSEPLDGPIDGFHFPLLFLHLQTYFLELDECLISQTLVDQMVGVEQGVTFEAVWPASFHSLYLEPIMMPSPPCLLYFAP